MHPIERLRYVARAGGADHGDLAEETARALAGFVDDPAGLVTACRRILERHPTSGPMWWLVSNVLATNDPRAAAFRCVSTLQEDPTAAALAYELPDDATITVVGWNEHTGQALARRGDLQALVVDVLGEGGGLVRRLLRSDSPAEGVDPAATAGAIAASSLVVLEASAVGPDGFVAVTGSLAAATLAAHLEVPVWLVVGEGRLLPGRVFEAATRTLTEARSPWEAEEEIVPLALVARTVGPRGQESVEATLRRTDTPIVPELLRS